MPTVFARDISSFTRTWMNLGCKKRLQSISTMTYHETRHMTLRLRIKLPTLCAWGSNSPPPGKAKQSNARGMPGGGGGGGDVEASI